MVRRGWEGGVKGGEGLEGEYSMSMFCLVGHVVRFWNERALVEMWKEEVSVCRVYCHASHVIATIDTYTSVNKT